MSVSQVIAACGGSLNRGSHLSGDACHMMPRSLARGAGRERASGRFAPGGGPHRAGVGPVRPVAPPAGRVRAGRRGAGRAVPTPMGTARPGPRGYGRTEADGFRPSGACRPAESGGVGTCPADPGHEVTGACAAPGALCRVRCAGCAAPCAPRCGAVRVRAPRCGAGAAGLYAGLVGAGAGADVSASARAGCRARGPREGVRWAGCTLVRRAARGARHVARGTWAWGTWHVGVGLAASGVPGAGVAEGRAF